MGLIKQENEKMNINYRHIVLLSVIIMPLLSACKTSPVEGEFGRLLHELKSKNNDRSRTALRELEEFSRKYPQSRFADDAEYISTCHKACSLDSDKAIVVWETFVEKNENKHIEEETKQQLGDVLKDVFYPYQVKLLEAQQAQAMLDGDKEVVRNKCHQIISILDASNEHHRKKIDVNEFLLKHPRWEQDPIK